MTQVFFNRTENFYKNVSNAANLMDSELTVSHLFRSGEACKTFTKPGLPYGEALAKKLGVREGIRILEVGPGLGDLAGGLLKGSDDFHYAFVDISFDVIRNLKSRFRGGRFSFVTGDFLKEKFRERFDLVICNEVLADFPAIINMTLHDPKIKPEDMEEYSDAVALVRSLGLKLPAVSNFNYGAVKFLEKAKASLAEGGRIFVCEHSSDKPRKVGVLGHNEYTIDFKTLKAAAAGLKLGVAEKGKLSGLLGVNQRKAILFYTRPELKMIYGFLKRRGISLDQRPYEAAEVLGILDKAGVRIAGRKGYAALLDKNARPLRGVTDQFSYLILEDGREKQRQE